MKELEQSIIEIKSYLNHLESVVHSIKGQVLEMEELLQDLSDKHEEDTDKLTSQIIDEICKKIRPQLGGIWAEEKE